MPRKRNQLVLSIIFSAILAGYLFSAHPGALHNWPEGGKAQDRYTQQIAGFIQDVQSLRAEIAAKITAVEDFSKRLTKAFSALFSLLRWQTWILFFVLILVSYVFSLLGLPQGWYHFSLSLLASDYLLLSWLRIFQGADFSWSTFAGQYLLESHLLLLAPFALFQALRMGWPWLRKIRFGLQAGTRPAQFRDGLSQVQQEALRLLLLATAAGEEWQDRMTQESFARGLNDLHFQIDTLRRLASKSGETGTE